MDDVHWLHAVKEMPFTVRCPFLVDATGSTKEAGALAGKGET